MKKTLFLLFIICVLINSGNANEVRSFTLENGLDVVMMPDASSPLLSSLLIVHTGSSFETLASAGSTHLLEHMIFRGTTKRTQNEIYDSFDRMGAYYNAQTSKTYTNFILVTPSENAFDAMDIQADMVLHSVVDPDTLEIEKGRVIAEIQQSLNRTSYKLELAHLNNVYGGTAYGFSTLGSIEGIRGVPRDVVKGFHDDWYCVNNMTLVLRGNLSFSEMKKLANDIYGSETAKPLPDRPNSWPVGFDDWRAEKLHISYSDVKSGMIQITLPAPRFDDADYVSYQILSLFIDDALDRELRGKGRPSITYVYSSLSNDPEFSVLDITAGLMPGADPQAVLDGILNAVGSIAEMTFDENEFYRKIKADKRSELFFSEQVQYGSFLLVPKLAVAPWGFWDFFEKQRDTYNIDVAADVALEWFEDPLWIASAILPDTEDDAAKGVSLGEVINETLENGVQIVARPVLGAPVAGIHIGVKNRSLLEGADKKGWVDLLHRLLLKTPIQQDSTYLETRMDEIGMEMQVVDDSRVPMDDYRTIPEYSYIRVQSVADNWANALALTGEVLANSSIEERFIEEASSTLSGIISRKKGSLKSEVYNRFDSLLFGENIHAGSIYGNGSNLEGISLDELSEFRSRVFSADNLVISILAPADSAEIIEACKYAFGSLPTGQKTNLNYSIPEMTPTVETINGKGNQGFLASGFIINNVAPEDHAALIVANAMVSDMIYRDLGEAKGWAYGAGSGLKIRDGWAAWTIGMGLPEEHLKESESISYKYLAQIAKGEFDEKRLEVARGDRRGKILRRYSSRINLAMSLGHDQILYDNPLYTWEVFDQLNQLTIKDVKAVAKKYLKAPKKFVTIYGIPDPDGEKPKRPPMGMGGMMGH